MSNHQYLIAFGRNPFQEPTPPFLQERLLSIMAVCFMKLHMKCIVEESKLVTIHKSPSNNI